MTHTIRRFGLTILVLLALLGFPAVTAQAPVPETTGGKPPPSTAVPSAGPRPDQGSGLVYLTSLDIGDGTFAVYDPDTDTWTDLGYYDTGCQMAVSASGQLYAYGHDTGTIDLYDPGTDTWSAVLPVPPGSDGVQGNLEITTAGEFLYTEWDKALLWYTSGGGWNWMVLPFWGNAMGDYDPTTDQYVIGEAWTTHAHLIDVHTWAITDYYSPVPNGENARFSSVLDNRYFFEAGGSNIHSFDLSNPALPPFDHGVSGPWYGSSAADRAHHSIYVTDLDGDPFWVFDPAAGTLTPLAAHGGLWHSSLAFVPAESTGPDIEVNPTSLSAEQCPDTVTEEMLQICNVGDAELIWSLSEGPGRYIGKAVPEVWVAGATVSNDASAFTAGASRSRITGGPEVLIIQDEDPWGYTSVKDVLDANGIAYDLATSADIPTIDLPYGLVVIPSNQPDSFYEIWNANVDKFEEYVEDGGALWLSTCAYSSTWPEPLVPGGVINSTDLENYNLVVEPGHPWVAGVPNPIYGTYASHDSFSNLYAGSIVVAQAQDTAQPTLVDYLLGSGRILITGQTLEYGWANGQDNALILQNSLLDMVAWEPADLVPWLSADPTAGGLNPGGCGEVTVTFDSTGMEAGSYYASLVIDSNDPDEPQVIVPVELTVQECEQTMHLAAMWATFHTDPFGRILIRMFVTVHDGEGEILGSVAVDGSIWWPTGGPVERTRITKEASGTARFHWGSVAPGTWQLCVDDLAKEGYTYVPGDNQVPECASWSN